MSEVRCPCGFGRLEECERVGHERGAHLDHERVLRNLDRAQKRVRKFKRAMEHFFPHLDSSEADSALRALYDETQELERRVNALDREAYQLRKENFALKNPDAATSEVPLSTATNIGDPWWDASMPVTVAGGDQALRRLTDLMHPPEAADPAPEAADPAPEDLDGY